MKNSTNIFFISLPGH